MNQPRSEPIGYHKKMVPQPITSDSPRSAEPLASYNRVDLKGLYRILFQGRYRIALTAGAVFLLATVIAFLLPAQYTATAAVIPPSTGGSSSAAALMGQLSALGGGAMLGGAIKNPGDLYVGIVRSRSIAQILVQRFDLLHTYKLRKESQAEKILAQQTNVTVGPKDGIISIGVTDRNPERARDLVAGYLEALRSTTASLALTESSQRRLFYEQRLLQEKTDLANAEVALKQTQETSGLVAPAGQTATGIQAIAQLQAQIAGRQVRLASLRHDETEQNPDIIRLQSEIADLQAQVARMESGTRKGQYGSISTAQVPALELDYIRRTRDVKYHEALFEIIARQYEAARLDEAHEPSLQILDPPVVPDARAGPPRLLIMAFGLALGLLGGVLWVLFLFGKRLPPLPLRHAR